MKTKAIIFIIEESFDGGYETGAVGESIFTEAETIDELKKNIAEAVRCHFDEYTESSETTYQLNQEK